MTEHVRDELEAYALGALDRADAEPIAAHLADCAACREEAAALADVVATLPETVALREPRSALRERILDAARDEVRPPKTAVRPWPLALGRVRVFPVLSAGLMSAVIVLAAADLDSYQRLERARAERDEVRGWVDSIREGGRWWYMAGKDDFAGAGGTLIDPRAAGKQPFVLFHDLPAIPQEKVLTVWLVSPEGTWARAATFHPSGSDLEVVRITMEVTGFDRCAVTLEDSPWGRPAGPVVMESRIAPPGPQ